MTSRGVRQLGNNNAYCQDNEISWIDWERVDVGLRSFVRWLLAFRRDHPVLRTMRWPTGVPNADGVSDVSWYNPEGLAMTPADWQADYARSVAVLFDGRAVRAGRAPPTATRPAEGSPGQGPGEVMAADSVYAVFNAHDGRLLYRLPPTAWPSIWRRVLDTSEPLPAERLRRYGPGDHIRVEGHSVVILTGLSPTRGVAGRSRG